MYIEISALNFKYKNAKDWVINDFHFSIDQGEVISIFGQSGSGKSTVLRIIAGLELPESGSIKIGDKIMVDDKSFVLPEKRQIGMVFQDYALFPHLTVEGNIKFGLKNMTKREKDNRINEVLELVNLKEFKRRYPYELSGGQQQRVALARALAPKPSLLLLDEPFSNLDADLQAKIREELKLILKQTGITSIFVTHDREDSLAIADRVVILDQGKFLKAGKPEEVFM